MVPQVLPSTLQPPFFARESCKSFLLYLVRRSKVSPEGMGSDEGGSSGGEGRHSGGSPSLGTPGLQELAEQVASLSRELQLTTRQQPWISSFGGVVAGLLLCCCVAAVVW